MHTRVRETSGYVHGHLLCRECTVVMCVCVRYCKPILYGEMVGTAIFIWAGINTGFFIVIVSETVFGGILDHTQTLYHTLQYVILGDFPLGGGVGCSHAFGVVCPIEF